MLIDGNVSSYSIEDRTAAKGTALAIYLVFRLASETEDQVTYEFGGADHQFDRAVTIRKSDYLVTFAGGKEDRMAAIVAGMTMSRHRADGNWVRFGSRQS